MSCIAEGWAAPNHPRDCSPPVQGVRGPNLAVPSSLWVSGKDPPPPWGLEAPQENRQKPASQLARDGQADLWNGPPGRAGVLGLRVHLPLGQQSTCSGPWRDHRVDPCSSFVWVWLRTLNSKMEKGREVAWLLDAVNWNGAQFPDLPPTPPTPRMCLPSSVVYLPLSVNSRRQVVISTPIPPPPPPPVQSCTFTRSVSARMLPYLSCRYSVALSKTASHSGKPLLMGDSPHCRAP